jgi:large subunit ribosomal protein L5
MNRLKQQYLEKVLPKLKQEFKITNDLAVPRLLKLVVNVSVTDDQNRDASIKNTATQLAAITGQKAVIRKAKKSIAGFKLRQGDPVGLSVTLRGDRMYQFLDKTISIVVPRVKDFQGLPSGSFDGGGNYNFGLTEQIIFPEIDYDKIDKIRGLQITLVTSAETNEQAKSLLVSLGLPLEKPDTNQQTK